MAKTRAWFLGVCFLGIAAGVLAACGNAPSPGLNDSDLENESDIINGRPSTLRDYPATGALLIRGQDDNGDPFAAICTGTLIAPDVVLTAAHCAENMPGVRYFFSLSLDVTRAGFSAATMPSSTVEVSSLVTHPDFGISNKGGLGQSNDLALAYLSRRFVGVNPARMLSPSEASWLRVDQPVDIVGYGVRAVPDEDVSSEDSGATVGTTADTSESQQTLRPVSRTANNTQAGVKSTAQSTITEVGPWELQIGHGLPEPEKCFGDSGGPTYIRTNRGSRLVGITSHTYDRDAFARGTVDERVDAMASWIKTTMDAACAQGLRPACKAARR